LLLLEASRLQRRSRTASRISIAFTKSDPRTDHRALI